MIENELGIDENEYLTLAEVQDFLREMVYGDLAKYGDQRKMARYFDEPAGFFCDVVTLDRPPSQKILDALGLEKKTITVYVTKGTNGKNT